MDKRETSGITYIGHSKSDVKMGPPGPLESTFRVLHTMGNWLCEGCLLHIHLTQRMRLKVVSLGLTFFHKVKKITK